MTETSLRTTDSGIRNVVHLLPNNVGPTYDMLETPTVSVSDITLTTGTLIRHVLDVSDYTTGNNTGFRQSFGVFRRGPTSDPHTFHVNAITKVYCVVTFRSVYFMGSLRLIDIKVNVTCT